MPDTGLNVHAVARFPVEPLALDDAVPPTGADPDDRLLVLVCLRVARGWHLVDRHGDEAGVEAEHGFDQRYLEIALVLGALNFGLIPLEQRSRFPAARLQRGHSLLAIEMDRTVPLLIGVDRHDLLRSQTKRVLGLKIIGDIGKPVSLVDQWIGDDPLEQWLRGPHEEIGWI
jgi:hypothetical protein